MPAQLSHDSQNETIPLPKQGSWPESVHLFDEESVWAVNAALASGRPLLVRGEPGTGKSQLARAAAVKLGWPFLSRVVNARFEPEDLLYRFDAVARLSEAQVLPKTGGDAKAVEEKLKPQNFLLPEILWWAFDSTSALKQYKRARNSCGEGVPALSEEAAGKAREDGVVVLIDEIDKADSEVPNSLLEALGNGGFQVPYGGEEVTVPGKPPLVIVTTNEDRELPPAFLRRCLVLQLDLPHESKQEEAFRAVLVERAAKHFPGMDAEVVKEAISQLIEDRKLARERDLPRPGQAELLDILRALEGIGERKEAQLEALGHIAAFAFTKNRAEEL